MTPLKRAKPRLTMPVIVITALTTKARDDLIPGRYSCFDVGVAPIFTWRLEMSTETDLDHLRPEFADLSEYVPTHLAADVQAYMDCMGAIVAAKEFGDPMPIFVTFEAFGRIKLFSVALHDMCIMARDMVKNGEAQAQAIMRQGRH